MCTDVYDKTVTRIIDVIYYYLGLLTLMANLTIGNLEEKYCTLPIKFLLILNYVISISLSFFDYNT